MKEKWGCSPFPNQNWVELDIMKDIKKNHHVYYKNEIKELFLSFPSFRAFIER